MINKALVIRSWEDIKQAIEAFNTHKPKFLAFDTETNGLNIKHHKPFLIVFGFASKEETFTFSIDLEKCLVKEQAITAMHKMAKRCEKIVAKNTTFDLHMLRNANINLFSFEKLTDLAIYIRLGHPPLQPEHGGPPMGLLRYAKRYLDPNALAYEQKIKEELKLKRIKLTNKLKESLNEVDVVDEFKVTGKEQKWTKGMIHNFLKDKVNEVKDFPPEIQGIISNWQKELKEDLSYNNLDRKMVTNYAHIDVHYTLWAFLSLYDFVQANQKKAVEIEEKAIKGFYTLECTGVELDIDYTRRSQRILKEYILKLRKQMQEVINEDNEIKVGQHDELKKHIEKRYNVRMESTDVAHLQYLIRNDFDENLQKLARIIIELRTVEKWYSTYIIRWIEEYEEFKDNTIYPTYDSTGTVTGRVSSDFQQFPRRGFFDIDGNLLFKPRQMFVCPKGYNLVYIDYNAMEVRLLAIYTQLVSEGDLKLCRAFIPFQCVKRNSKWYLKEDPKLEWKPTDIHGETACTAFNITPNDASFKEKRELGKRANFSIIYGASINKLKESLEIPHEMATSLYRAFHSSFPKVNHYVRYLDGQLTTKNYVENLFGRKYDNITTHKAKNYLIQGSGADYTKQILVQLVEFLENYDAKIQGYLHDEFSFIIPPHEMYIIPKLIEIMEQLETEIKLTASAEVSYTHWGAKKPYELP